MLSFVWGKYYERHTIHRDASSLSKNSETYDWPRYNGPSDDASSTETKLLEKWEKNGPELIWEVTKGEGYASPIISKDILVLFHRQNGMEIIDGINPENG